MATGIFPPKSLPLWCLSMIHIPFVNCVVIITALFKNKDEEVVDTRFAPLAARLKFLNWPNKLFHFPMLRLYTSHRPLSRSHREARPSRMASAGPTHTVPTSVFNLSHTNSVQRRFRFKSAQLPAQFRQILKPPHLREKWLPTARQFLQHLKESEPTKKKNVRIIIVVLVTAS